MPVAPIPSSELKLSLSRSAYNSGGSSAMLRREVSKTFFRSLNRGSGLSSRPRDAKIIASAGNSGNNYQYPSSSEYSRSYATGGNPVRSSASAAPSNEKPAMRSLNDPSIKRNLELQRVQEQERLRSNGFSHHRARSRFQRHSRADVVNPISQGTHLPLAAAAATPAAADEPIAVSTSAPTSNVSGPSFTSTTSSSSNDSSSSSSNGTKTPVASLHTTAPKSTTSTTAKLSASAALSDDEDFDLDVPNEVVDTVYKNEPPPDVYVVNTVADARRIAARLASSELSNRLFACDTEVMDIDLKRHSPCCHGHVICFSIYCGPDVDFSLDSNSSSSGTSSEATPFRSMLWVDTYLDGDEAKAEEVGGIIDAFRLFWESDSIKKVWHNYSFDRHVMERLGVKMNGFDGDTMHMARLWDSSRVGRGGYSLEALSSDKDLMGATEDLRGKVSMKKLFGKPNLKKDGTEGKLTVLPPVHELQSREDTYWRWVNYSAYDAKSTWDLHAALESELRAEPAKLDEAVAAAYARSGIEIKTLWDLYRATWRPFGGLLTDMEAAGMAVDRAHLAEAQERAVREEEAAKMRFRDWATSKVADAAYMNVGSGPQVSQLLFGGVDNRWNDRPGVPLERTFKVPNQLPPEEGKKAKKNMDIILHNIWSKIQKSPLVPDIYTPSGVPACSTPVLKALAGKAGRARKALADIGAANEGTHGAAGLEALRDDFDDDAATPWSTDDAEIAKLQIERQEALRERTLKEMAEIGEKNGYGKLFQYFSTVPDGLAACAAVDSLIDASAIDTLLSNFIVPLQSDDISKPDASGVYRVHCSLNINTETGRLSARRPNLQNQPALEKDRYRVRKAFTADRKAGKTLIVADYGQLELRILAHMANCHSMLTAFKLGGDFHSRTALGMYDHIQDAIAKGNCLLEWDGVGEDGHYTPPPVPLLKDLYGAERRRAKVLNFSIAYGKTAHGLSKDWGVSLKEAGETVDRWYADRKEVESWQKDQRFLAEHEGYVCTILGRRRQLPEARSGNKAAKAHALRAAINTPIQGSAADVATAAMLRITADERLREMGWRLLLQVHDEVILEGPKETAEIAQAVVVECMRSPFGDAGGDPLRVELAVDSKYADTWYDAK